MKPGIIYQRNDGLKLTVLELDEKHVTCRVVDIYGLDRTVEYARVGFVASLGTGKYKIIPTKGKPNA